MIRLTAALSLGLLLGAVNIAPASSQALPNGSYTSSCTRVRMTGNNMVTANCTAPNGGHITSSTSAYCRGDIANVNGYLQCNGNAYGNGNGIGNGNRRGDRDRDGDRDGNRNGNRYGNGNGNGNGNYMNGGMPQGSYMQSCTNARMQGRMLFAVCPTGGGGRVETSLNTQFCRNSSDIANRNGYLECER